MTYQLRL